MTRRKSKTGRPPATERRRRRRRSGVAGGSADVGRWSSNRKMEAVLRLLRGEALDAVSRELSEMSSWRDGFLASRQAELKARQPDHRDEQIKELHAKIGQLTRDKQVLEEFVDRVEGRSGRPPFRRSKP